MNKITRPSEMQTPEVTTGPIVGSRKVYSSPEGHPDIRVPLREIALHESSGEPPFRTCVSFAIYKGFSNAHLLAYKLRFSNHLCLDIAKKILCCGMSVSLFFVACYVMR